MRGKMVIELSYPYGTSLATEKLRLFCVRWAGFLARVRLGKTFELLHQAERRTVRSSIAGDTTGGLDPNRCFVYTEAENC